MTQLLTCDPVHGSEVYGPAVVNHLFQQGECDDCGKSIWISPEHMELYELHPDAYLLYCRECAGIEHALAKGQRRP